MGFPTNTGLLVAAKGGMGGQVVVVVDPHSTCFYGSGYPQSPVDILSLDGTAQTILAVICHPDYFIFIFELNDANYRPENLFLGNPHTVIDFGQDGRFHETTLIQPVLSDPVAAKGHLSSFLLADFNVRQDLVKLVFVDLRARGSSPASASSAQAKSCSRLAQ